MLQIPTVILHHLTVAGSHYDWLWLDPQSGDHLAGYRVPYPPSQWQPHQSFLAEPLPPHRLAYLTYQGHISGERGSVVQVARGTLAGNRIGKVGWDWLVHLHGSHALPRTQRVRILPFINAGGPSVAQRVSVIHFD